MNLNSYSLWTALVTPLNPDLTVDFKSFGNLLREQEKAGNGLLVLGSTGEALNLSNDQKKEIVAYTAKLAGEEKFKCPIMVGVSGHQLQDTIEWMNYLERFPFQAYLMVTPIYAKPGAEGQYHWFNTLMNISTRPCMLYNVPGRAGAALSVDAVKRLNNHKNFWAIKEASGSVEKFKEYLSAAGKNVFCGDDALMPDFALAGSCGLVSVASNVWPEQTHKYVTSCLNKTFDAKELWTNASNSMFIASNPVPAKRALYELGRIAHKTMMPPLSDLDLKDYAPIATANKNVNEWFKSHN